MSKKCIITRYYESPRDSNINQTSYIADTKGGEILRGEWTLDENEAKVFDTKSHANSIIKLIGLEGMSLIEKDNTPEFKIGETVTLDRYNHIDDVETVKVVGYGEMMMSKRLTYKMDVNGTIIESTGGSIMESKNYNPAPEEDRHYRKNASVMEIEEYWEKKRKK